MTDQDISIIENDLKLFASQVDTLERRLTKGGEIIAAMEAKGEMHTEKYQKAFNLWNRLLLEYQEKETAKRNLMRLKQAWQIFNDNNFTPKAG